MLRKLRTTEIQRRQSYDRMNAFYQHWSKFAQSPMRFMAHQIGTSNPTKLGTLFAL
jgi:hypothetical protein